MKTMKSLGVVLAMGLSVAAASGRVDTLKGLDLRSYLTPLSLSRLNHAQIESMVEHVTGGRALPVEVVQQVAAKTDG